MALEIDWKRVTSIYLVAGTTLQNLAFTMSTFHKQIQGK